jgi:hypothetical protein
MEVVDPMRGDGLRESGFNIQYTVQEGPVIEKIKLLFLRVKASFTGPSYNV